MSIRIYGDDLLGSLLTFAMNAVPGAVGAGISIAAELGDQENCSACSEASGSGSEHAHPGQPRSVAAVGVARELDRAQWEQAGGPLWEAFRSGMLVSLPSLGASTDGVNGLSGTDGSAGHDPVGLGGLKGVRAEVVSPVRGLVLSPGEWGGELPVILSVYLDREPDSKSLQVIDRWEPLVSQALAVVEYCSGQEQVAEQMLQMNQYRRVIEQAKGLIMGALGCDAPTAFATLARSSQHFNVRLRNLAVALVEHVGTGNVEHPEDPDLRINPNPAERSVAERVWAALTTSTAILPTIEV